MRERLLRPTEAGQGGGRLARRRKWVGGGEGGRAGAGAPVISGGEAGE